MHTKVFLFSYGYFPYFQDMILRLSFILGNLMAKSDLSRTRFFQQPKSLDVLLTVFKYYLDLDQKVRIPCRAHEYLAIIGTLISWVSY